MSIFAHHWLLFLSLGTVLDDVGGFLSGVFSSVGDLAKKVWSAIRSAVTWVSHIFDWVGSAWEGAYHGFTSMLHWLEQAVQGAYDEALWIVEHWIPDQIGQTIKDVGNLAGKVASTAEHYALSLVKGAIHTLTGAIGDVLSFARHVYDVVHTDVLKALHWIENEGTQAFYWASHPDKLAERLAGLILAPLLRVIEGSARAVIRWALAFLRAHMGSLVSDLEDVLTEVF